MPHYFADTLSFERHYCHAGHISLRCEICHIDAIITIDIAIFHYYAIDYRHCRHHYRHIAIMMNIDIFTPLPHFIDTPFAIRQPFSPPRRTPIISQHLPLRTPAIGS